MISISNFKLNKIDYSYEDEDIEDDGENNEDNEEEKNDKIKKNEKIKRPVLDINFESYHSSLNFIDHLCDI